MDRFDSLAPAEYRYRVDDVAAILSERAFLRYKLQVELAIAKVLCTMGKCSTDVIADFKAAIPLVTIEEVYALEQETGHDIQAMIDVLKKYVRPEHKKYVHRFATSYDIVETANAMRYRDVMQKVVLPDIRELLQIMITVVRREARTRQIGRSHGQAGLPITFGFALAWHLDRLGLCYKQIADAVLMLRGKFSGAMGAYNATRFFGLDPQEFEKNVLAEVGVTAGTIATQIVMPEPLTWLLGNVCDASGIIANMARDFRHLQRTEINEVREPKGKKQHGSSTMKQKRNPIGNENLESLWTIVFAQRSMLHFDAISEHQRDLTGSARSRIYPEMVNYVDFMIRRMTKIVKDMEVDGEQMLKNLMTHRRGLAGEPLYLVLGDLGHPDAPASSIGICEEAVRANTSVIQIMENDASFSEYLLAMSQEQRNILENPETYTGLSTEQALFVGDRWEQELST